jgi:hypothetical protein
VGYLDVLVYEIGSWRSSLFGAIFQSVDLTAVTVSIPDERILMQWYLRRKLWTSR